MKRTPLARLNLLHERTRTLVAVAGVAFAALLIFVQLGFLGAVRATATLVYDRLDFDVAVLSTEYQDLVRAGSFPRERLPRVRGLPGVASVRTISVWGIQWLNEDDERRGRRGILVIGIDPADSPFKHPELTPDVITKVRQPDTVLIDRRSREEFGPQDPGTMAELGTLPVTIVGSFELGTGFGADGLVIASQSTYARAFGPSAGPNVSLGLVKLKDGAAPGDAEKLAERLNELLPTDLQAVSRNDLLNRERDHWVQDTSLGKIFLMGVALAFVVGVVFVYQVMASDIGSRLGEFATLKAIGYGDGYVNKVVLQQALLLALAGFVPGVLAANGVYALTRHFALLPITMTWETAGLVLALVVVMCTASGFMALRKVRAADPADLF
jgi:putative ABC transport system permease protein